MDFFLSSFCRKECMGGNISCVCDKVHCFNDTSASYMSLFRFFFFSAAPLHFPTFSPLFYHTFFGKSLPFSLFKYTVSSRCLRNEGSSSSSFLQFTSFCNCCLLVPKAAYQVPPPPEHRGGTIQN